MKILVFSSVPWDFLWQRMQHVASELALRGHQVLYFEEPVYISVGSFIKNKTKGSQSAKIKKINDKLSVVTLYVPELRGKLESVKNRFLNSHFKSSLNDLEFKPDVAIFHSLEFVPLIEILQSLNSKITFDCADDILSFVSAGIKQGLVPSSSFRKAEAMENKLIKSSSTCFASSRLLCDKISKLNPNCIYLPNAMDFNHFNINTKRPMKLDDLPNLKHPVIGFIGAVFEWIDAGLICKLADAHPEYSILLVGPVNSGKDQLAAHSNIRMVGAKPYGDLPSYISNIDVCLIPFKINDITLASNPIKMYEYLAAGKPVVSTALPEVIRNASEVVYVSKDDEDFIRKVELAAKEIGIDKETAIWERTSFAKKNSWQSRVDVIEKVLNEITTG